MGEKSQINLKVDSSQKEEWEEFLDESGSYITLSGLIRSAVDSEIEQTGEDGLPAESPALESDVESLKKDVERIRKDVTWLREQRQDQVDISELAQEVFDELHTLPDVDTIEVDGDPREVRAVTGIQEYGPQTVPALAEELDSEPSQIDDALEHLQDQFLPVVSVEVEGQRHYFKEE